MVLNNKTQKGRGGQNLLVVEEVERFGLLRGELGESAAPFHHAARSVVFDVRLGLHLLDGRGAGGGAKKSAEAAATKRERKRATGRQPTTKQAAGIIGAALRTTRACWEEGDNHRIDNAMCQLGLCRDSVQLHSGLIKWSS